MTSNDTLVSIFVFPVPCRQPLNPKPSTLNLLTNAEVSASELENPTPGVGCRVSGKVGFRVHLYKSQFPSHFPFHSPVSLTSPPTPKYPRSFDREVLLGTRDTAFL